ncbi:hypothetical protein Leryth_008360 [Lithospermum erythrorhizon]|nr:hypothetical protein Leryth_008360 [Lithospermum erythrorhizon]
MPVLGKVKLFQTHQKEATFCVYSIISYPLGVLLFLELPRPALCMVDISPRFSREETVRWMRALFNRVHSKIRVEARLAFLYPRLKYSSSYPSLLLRYTLRGNSVIDWLVDKLGTKVHAYFWLDEYSGKEAFARYRRDEWASGLTAWRKALAIEDVDVTLNDHCASNILIRNQQSMLLEPWFGICNL